VRANIIQNQPLSSKKYNIGYKYLIILVLIILLYTGIGQVWLAAMPQYLDFSLYILLLYGVILKTALKSRLF
jgi:hypothetical protein